MNRQLAWSVVADGGTDSLLVPIIQWVVHRLDPGVEILEPEFRKRTGSVAEFLTTYESGAMLIFVHRDSENLGLDERRREFETVERQDVVPVVPVRMSESWLLFDGPAIAKAAGSPSSQVPVPRIAEIENIPDPKHRLDELLFQAAGHPRGARARSSSVQSRDAASAWPNTSPTTVRSNACLRFRASSRCSPSATRTGTSSGSRPAPWRAIHADEGTRRRLWVWSGHSHSGPPRWPPLGEHAEESLASMFRMSAEGGCQG